MTIATEPVKVSKGLGGMLRFAHTRLGRSDDPCVMGGTVVDLTGSHYKSPHRTLKKLKKRMDAYAGGESHYGKVWGVRLHKGGSYQYQADQPILAHGLYVVACTGQATLLIDEQKPVTLQPETFVLMPGNYGFMIQDYEGGDPFDVLLFELKGGRDVGGR